MGTFKIECLKARSAISTKLELTNTKIQIGMGTDIEDIDRFRDKEISNNSQLLNKIFTKRELNYCFNKKDYAPHLAARFAAKEATFKAINSILEKNIDFKKIEIYNNITGVPKISLLDAYYKNWKIFVSLSHCDNKALAFVIVVL